MKDAFGRELKAKDWIVYAASRKTCAAIRVGRITEIKGEYASARVYYPAGSVYGTKVGSVRGLRVRQRATLLADPEVLPADAVAALA